MMKHFISGAILAVASATAAAGWDSIAALNGVQFFWDSKDVRRSGSMVQVWVLTEHKVPKTNSVDGSQYKSSKTQYEIDCKKVALRGLQQSQHKGSMGQGSVGYTINEASPWDPVPPESVFSLVFKKVCGAAN